MVEFRSPKPHALAWIDIETTGVPKTESPNDFSTVHMLEITLIVTDFDLEPMAGYTTVIRPTAEAVAALKGNAYVLNMHRTSGLLADLKGESVDVRTAEQEMITMLAKRTSLGKGEFMIAGSGVASFDFPLLKTWMPSLAEYMAYYPFDIGVQRRVARILSGNRQLVPPNTASYGSDKTHRSHDDVLAHIEEARQWQAFYRDVK